MLPSSVLVDNLLPAACTELACGLCASYSGQVACLGSRRLCAKVPHRQWKPRHATCPLQDAQSPHASLYVQQVPQCQTTTLLHETDRQLALDTAQNTGHSLSSGHRLSTEQRALAVLVPLTWHRTKQTELLHGLTAPFGTCMFCWFGTFRGSRLLKCGCSVKMTPI